MDQDSSAVLESAPAEAAAPLGLKAAVEKMRALNDALAKSRRRVQEHEARLKELRAQMEDFSGKFGVLRERVEAAAKALPAEPPAPVRAEPEPVPVRVETPAAAAVLEVVAVPRPLPAAAPSPARPRRLRMAGLWPYAVLAAAALALAPHISLQSGSPVAAEALARVPVQLPEPDRSKEAIALALSFRPEGSARDFAQLLGPQLDTAGPSAWDAQSVGNGVYLVSFRPHDVMGPQADYEFTVDVNARLVTPEPDTEGRLFAGN